MAKEKVFEKNSVIFKENSMDLCMYDIVSGKVGIYANYGADNEALLTELGAGKYFGEMGVIDVMPRSATAVALEDTTVKVIEKDELEVYFKENPDKVINIMQNLSGRLRELTKDYIDACDTVAEYVANQDAKKPQKEGLIAKIKKMIEISEAYSQKANSMIETYPYLIHNNFFY